MDIILRFDASQPRDRQPPNTAEAARQRLEEGNRSFARWLEHDEVGATRSKVIACDPRDVGLSEAQGAAPAQRPYAAVLACSDARVPPELVFQHACNQLFVARVAGNVLGGECMGSIEYAVGTFDSVRLLVVLGHSGCGAVTAAVHVFLHPAHYPEVASTQALRCIIDAILVGVRGGAQALHDHLGAGVEHRPGYAAALVETAVALNAAMTAWSLQQELPQLPDRGIEVVFGVYDLVNRRVGLPIDSPQAHHPSFDGLRAAPRNVADFEELAKHIVTGGCIGALLESAPRT